MKLIQIRAALMTERIYLNWIVFALEEPEESATNSSTHGPVTHTIHSAQLIYTALTLCSL